MGCLVQHGKLHNQKGSHVTERGAKEVTDLLHKVAEAGGLDDLPRWPEDTDGMPETKANSRTGVSASFNCDARPTCH